MRAEGGKTGKGKKKRKEKEKGREIGDQNVFFFVFSYVQCSFFKYIRKTIARLSRLYPQLFAIKW